MGMVLSKEATQAIIGYKPMGPRMIKARFHTQNGKATIVQVYLPTTSPTEQEIDELYEELQQTMQEIKSQDHNGRF